MLQVRYTAISLSDPPSQKAVMISIDAASVQAVASLSLNSSTMSGPVMIAVMTQN